jgi:hypothetical protein
MIGTFSIVKQEVPMTQEKVSPLRERMMEDMRIRGMQETSQKAHIRALKDFATFLGRSPAPLCASFGWSILLRRTNRSTENVPILTVINAKIMSPMTSEPPQMHSTDTPRPKQTYSGLALSP